MNDFYCTHIAQMLKDLKNAGANVSMFEEELDSLNLRISQFKALYDRNEHHNFK